MRTKLILVSLFSIIFSGCVIARDYPSVIPLTLSEGELNDWLEDRRQYSRVEKQEIALTDEVKITAILLEIGSGIIRVNTHIYMCEKSECKLIAYNVLKSSEVSIEIDYDSEEMLMKSNDGSILSRTKYQWIGWLRNMKEKEKINRGTGSE